MNIVSKTLLTKNTRLGIGVLVDFVMKAIVRGICPSLAPTKNNLDDAKIPPLTDPKVEQATNRGINHAIGPNNRYPKV